jgi:sucrose 6(F)-phosphate phosphorylase
MNPKNKVQLITYPDSLGRDLKTLNFVLDNYFKDLFPGGIHILPPYPSTGDRGFSPISYFEIDPKFGKWGDVQKLGEKYDLMLDMMVNHISSKSIYFLDYINKGSDSEFAEMFLDIKKTWPEGNPSKEELDKIFLRRTLPFSSFEVGYRKEKRTLWTTFGKGTPSDQIDIDVNSTVTKNLFIKIVESFEKHKIKFIRLDAIGYVIKKRGTSCFFVKPEIYQFLDWIKEVAAKKSIEILPELHAEYSIQKELSEHDFWIYDFMLPYLILEALINKNSKKLKEYLKIRPLRQFTMLDCHDGIPVKPDLNGFYDLENINQLINICIQRGANFSRLLSTEHKDQNGFDVHQIRGTYYSMLNEDDDAYIAARAIQLFTPGIPQIYYIGLLAGINDLSAYNDSGDGREINRHSYSLEEIEHELNRPVVKRLMRLIEFRNSNPAFDGNCVIDPCTDQEISMTWTYGSHFTRLKIDLQTCNSDIIFSDIKSGEQVHWY